MLTGVCVLFTASGFTLDMLKRVKRYPWVPGPGYIKPPRKCSLK